MILYTFVEVTVSVFDVYVFVMQSTKSEKAVPLEVESGPSRID